MGKQFERVDACIWITESPESKTSSLNNYTPKEKISKSTVLKRDDISPQVLSESICQESINAFISLIILEPCT